jgi:hypothetical protein
MEARRHSEKQVVEEIEGKHGHRVDDGLEKMTRAVLWKLDTRSFGSDAQTDALANQAIRILPVLAIMFLCSFLDRTNVGNARLLVQFKREGGTVTTVKLTTYRYNLEADLQMTDKEYDTGCRDRLSLFVVFVLTLTIVAVFYATYIVRQVRNSTSL